MDVLHLIALACFAVEALWHRNLVAAGLAVLVLAGSL